MYLLIELNLSYNQYITVSLSKNMYSPPTVSRLDTIFIFCVIFSLRLHLMYIDGQHEHMQNNIVQEVDSALFFFWSIVWWLIHSRGGAGGCAGYELNMSPLGFASCFPLC